MLVKGNKNHKHSLVETKVGLCGDDHYHMTGW